MSGTVNPICSDAEYDDTDRRLAEVELLIEQCADQEDYDSAEYYAAEERLLQRAMKAWKQ